METLNSTTRTKGKLQTLKSTAKTKGHITATMALENHEAIGTTSDIATLTAIAKLPSKE